jgi:hypothetical protein
MESPPTGDLKKLDTLLTRINTIGSYYELRGIKEFIKYRTQQGLLKAVALDDNKEFILKFRDKYQLQLPS